MGNTALRGLTGLPPSTGSYVVRPMVGGGETQFVKISEITYVDEFDPTTNFYGANAQCALNADVTIYRRAVVRFPEPVTIGSVPAMLCIDSLASVQVTTWDYTNTPMNMRFFVDIAPITSWGGRTISDLTWNNFGDLSIGPNLATATILAAVGTTGDTSALGIYTGDLIGGGETYAGGSETRIGAYILNQNPGQTIEGLAFYPSMAWSNLWYGATPASGIVTLTKPTDASSPTTDAFFFTNT